MAGLHWKADGWIAFKSQGAGIHLKTRWLDNPSKKLAELYTDNGKITFENKMAEMHSKKRRNNNGKEAEEQRKKEIEKRIDHGVSLKVPTKKILQNIITSQKIRKQLQFLKTEL